MLSAIVLNAPGFVRFSHKPTEFCPKSQQLLLDWGSVSVLKSARADNLLVFNGFPPYEEVPTFRKFAVRRLSKKTYAESMSGVAYIGRVIQSYTLNFGPQHPAAHGILRILLQTAGEVIQRADPQFGLLHRGSEKLMEARNALQSLPYFDRFDYVANFYQEHAYCLAVEALHASSHYLSQQVVTLRTFFDELNRVGNHLLTLSAVCMDMGAMGPMFWAFEEREQLMEFFERVSGARMHTALYRPFGLDESAMTRNFYRDVARFLNRSARALSGAFLGLLNNRSLKSRFASVGQMTAAKLQGYGITGIIARSGGWASDLRLQKQAGYGAYNNVSFRTFLGRRGDNLDRFLLRVKETVESLRILAQLARSLSPSLSAPARLPRTAKAPSNPVALLRPEGHAAPISGRGRFSGMEELISHFRESSEGWPTKPGLVYREVESPKGLVGVFAVMDGSSRPNRVKLRTPVAHNLHLIPVFSMGTVFADFVATFCSLDVVLGEIDR